MTKRIANTRYCWNGDSGKLYDTIIEAVADKPPEQPDPILVRLLVLYDETPPKLIHSVVLDKEAWT